MTTFQDRKLVRADLVALFVADGSWQDVYGYMPAPEAFTRSPVLIIRSAGTEQDMEGANTNPTAYRFICESYVVAFTEQDVTWTSELAENEQDNLDRVFRQVVRDNAGGTTNANLLLFEGGFSSVKDVVIARQAFVVESHGIIARLPRGAK